MSAAYEKGYPKTGFSLIIWIFHSSFRIDVNEMNVGLCHNH